MVRMDRQQRLPFLTLVQCVYSDGVPRGVGVLTRGAVCLDQQKVDLSISDIPIVKAKRDLTFLGRLYRFSLLHREPRGFEVRIARRWIYFHGPPYHARTLIE